jgi:hypothetical protein
VLRIFSEQAEDEACDAESDYVAYDKDRFFDGNSPYEVAGDCGE